MNDVVSVRDGNHIVFLSGSRKLFLYFKVVLLNNKEDLVSYTVTGYADLGY